ncbi:uncharacterized protein PG986_010316 [Apiospora aurea]|uniref:Uncharacterized protein n=1 Tax=Apiospora aurea TaxID=335848 RepID=A0ABR1Q1X4_9PEZI
MLAARPGAKARPNPAQCAWGLPGSYPGATLELPWSYPGATLWRRQNRRRRGRRGRGDDEAWRVR